MLNSDPKIEGKYTTLELIVNNFAGIHLRPSGMIVEECKKYDNIIYLKKKKNPSNEEYEPSQYNCKEVISFLIMAAEKNTRLKLYVEGTDAAAEKIARNVGTLISLSNEEAVDLYGKKHYP